MPKAPSRLYVSSAGRELVKRKARRDGQRLDRAATDLIARGAEAEGIFFPEKKGPRK